MNDQVVTNDSEIAAHAEPISARRAAVTAGLGTAIEYYDFQLYSVLAVTLSPLFFPNQDPTAALLATLAIFAGAFLMRPIGGIFFGWLGDTYGRSAALMFTIIGIGITSGCIGLLPTYASIGLAAPALLLLLRLAQGFFAGGEISGATTYVAEYSPTDRRGFYGAFNPAAATMGLTLAAGTAGTVAALFGLQAMQEWSWRIPFLISIPLAILCYRARSRLEESPKFRATIESNRTLKAPIRELLRHHRRAILQLVFLGFAQSATGYVCLVYLNIHLTRTLGYDSTQTFWLISAVTLIAVLLMPYCGGISDRVGRKRVMALGLLGYAVLTPLTMLVAGLGSFFLASVAVAIGALPFVLVQAAGYPLYAELFPTRVRYSGVALGFNIASILGGGTAPYVAAWLTNATGNNLAPSYYVMVASAVGLLTLTTMDETAGKPLA